jgi:DNA processing protein
MTNEERIYWVAWSKIKGVGSVLIQRLDQHFGSLSVAWKADRQSLSEVEGLGSKIGETIISMRSQMNPHAIYEQHLQKNPHFWTPVDPEYPRLLSEIPSPPPLLYYLGKVQPQENKGIIPMVGIVGTRYPTEHGKRWTRKISTALVKRGFTIVSGMALGIDAEAHNTALRTGGRTIAVVGTGVNQVYPSQHRQLHQQIQQQGLIISEYPDGVAPARNNFPARNRIIAALCRAILIMEAPEKSGALITARFGNEFGKDIYTLPNSPDIEEAKGCLRLIHDGAGMIVNEDELMEMLGAIPQLDTPKQLSLWELNHNQNQKIPESVEKNIPQLEPQLQQIFDSLTEDQMPFDLIVETAGLSSAQVSGALLQLELMGLITQLPGMRYRRN